MKNEYVNMATNSIIKELALNILSEYDRVSEEMPVTVAMDKALDHYGISKNEIDYEVIKRYIVYKRKNK